MTLIRIKEDPFYTRKIVLLHNVWNLLEGRQLFCTRIESEGLNRRLSYPLAGQKPEPIQGTTDQPLYLHPYTSVTVDFGYGLYQFDFDPSRPNVEGRVFS